MDATAPQSPQPYSPAPDLAAPGPASSRVRTRRVTEHRHSLPARVLRDPYVAYTVALIPVALLVALVSPQSADLLAVAVLSPPFVVAQVWLSAVPSRRRILTPLGWSFLRLAVTLLFVGGLVDYVGGPGRPLVGLYVPIVVAAAALGTTQAVVFGAVVSAIYLVPVVTAMGNSADLAMRGIALAGVSVLVAVGTRRLVIAVEGRTAKLRRSLYAERRRSRQIAGMETISRLLMAGGPLPELLDDALGVLVDRFGYHYVSIYLYDGRVLRLGGQRGYEHPLEVFDGSSGVVGRVLRTRQLAFVPDASADPDYVVVVDQVASEICGPLIVEGEFLGILNVEAREPLDRVDRDLVATLTSRVATVVALARDREALAQREQIFRSLSEFTQAISGTLELDLLAAAVVDGASRVLPVDLVSLTVLDRETGRYLVRAVTDVDPELLGREVRPGESLAGRAIRDRAIVLDDDFVSSQYPSSYREHAPEQRPALAAGIPLIRDGVVVGALTLLRYLPAEPFRPIEREVMDLLSGHAALAVANTFLLADVQELAIRDPLTSLYNRRYFDETLDRLLAAWTRREAAERTRISAIVFDLDGFGEFNKQYGHQVGDEVLRGFANVLRDRFRASDLVARLGGDEFIVVLDGAGRDEALAIGNEIRMRLEQLRLVNDRNERLQITVSGGCSELDADVPTRSALLRSTDVGLFMAKRAGRDRIVAA